MIGLEIPESEQPLIIKPFPKKSHPGGWPNYEKQTKQVSFVFMLNKQYAKILIYYKSIFYTKTLFLTISNNWKYFFSFGISTQPQSYTYYNPL